MTTLRELLGSPNALGVWNLDTNQSAVGFRARSVYGLLPVNGRFHEISGNGQITGEQSLSGSLTIKAASLDTGIKKRDKDLRAAAFFDVEKYPDITVVVNGVDAVSVDTVDLRADLTVKATTAPLRLHVRATVVDDASVRLTTQTDINRKDFGVSGNMLGMIPSGATLTADVVFRRTDG